jgi:poly(3-hydroxybutyrate) depolymerase
MKNKKAVVCALVLLFVAIACCTALFFKSSGCGSGSTFTAGEHTIISQGVERVFYVKLPQKYNPRIYYPLIFGFHGFSSDYRVFTEGDIDLQEAVGDEAILVYPNALEKNGEPQWDYESDLTFFDDLYAELEANLCFDKSKVFAVGHSNGAGFIHTLGCKRGNVLRAIGPVSGFFLDYAACTGQVAVIMIHGNSDTTIPLTGIKPTRDYWIAINSCKKAETPEGADPACVAYAGCDPQFPVTFCEHNGGHEWPDFAGTAIWEFFKSLPLAAPSAKTGDGDVDNLGKGSISFKIHYPPDFAGKPEKLAVSLYPPGSTLPLSGSPVYVLNMDVPLGDYTFGAVTEYRNVEINLLGVDYGDYAMAVNIYVAGGNYPIPTSGKDYMGLQNITINSTAIKVETPFELEVLIY